MITEKQLEDLKNEVLKKYGATLKDGASEEVCNEFKKAEIKWMDGWKIFLIQKNQKKIK